MLPSSVALILISQLIPLWMLVMISQLMKERENLSLIHLLMINLLISLIYLFFWKYCCHNTVPLKGDPEKW